MGFGMLHWSLKVLFFFSVCFALLGLAKFLECNDEKIIKIIKKIIAFLVDIFEDILMIIFAIFMH